MTPAAQTNASSGSNIIDIESSSETTESQDYAGVKSGPTLSTSSETFENIEAGASSSSGESSAASIGFNQNNQHRLDQRAFAGLRDDLETIQIETNEVATSSTTALLGLDGVDSLNLVSDFKYPLANDCVTDGKYGHELSSSEVEVNTFPP